MSITRRKRKANERSIAGRLIQSYSSVLGANGTTYSGTASGRLYVDTNCNHIYAKYSNLYRSASSLLEPLPNNMTIKASLVVNGTFYPMYFNGQREYNFKANIAAVAITDVLTLPTDINTATDTIFIRTYFSVPIGGTIPWGQQYYGTANSSARLGSDTYTANVDYVDGGTLGTITSQNAFGPNDVCAIPKDAPFRPYCAILGDSIYDGSGGNIYYYNSNQADATNAEGTIRLTTFPHIQGSSIVKRLAAMTPIIPQIRVTVGGDTVHHMVNNWNYRSGLLKGCDVAFSNYGFNDVSGTTYTLAEIQEDLLTLWRLIKTTGIRKVVQTTITPKTTSTDYWITLANQTDVLSAARQTIRGNLNAWLIDTSASGAVAQSDGNLDKVIDIRPYCESSNKWLNTDYEGNDYTTAIETGTCTADSTTTYTVVTATTFPTHAVDSRYLLHFTGGTGEGQYTVLIANSPATKYYFSPALTTAPDATTTYEVLRNPTGDGVHPSFWGYAAIANAYDLNQLLDISI